MKFCSKANIPGYTGHVHHFKTNSVSHYDEIGRPLTTTAAFHRKMPDISQFASSSQPSSNKSNCELATIQTKVPPVNAFNEVPAPTNVEINNSMDHMSHPIVVLDKTNSDKYLVNNRERELRSILKKRMTTTIY